MLLGQGVLKRHCHAIVVSLQKAKTCQPKNNGLVFLPRTILLHWTFYCHLLLQGGEDGNGLKLEKISQFFQVLKLCLEKIVSKLLWFALPAKFHLLSS